MAEIIQASLPFCWGDGHLSPLIGSCLNLPSFPSTPLVFGLCFETHLETPEYSPQAGGPPPPVSLSAPRCLPKPELPVSGAPEGHLFLAGISLGNRIKGSFDPFTQRLETLTSLLKVHTQTWMDLLMLSSSLSCWEVLPAYL